MSGRQAHRALTLLFSAAMIAVGVALLVEAVLAGVSVLRVLVGLLFVGAGAGRLYVERRRGAGGS